MKKSLEDYEVESLVDMTEPEVEGMVRLGMAPRVETLLATIRRLASELKAARAALAARDER